MKRSLLLLVYLTGALLAAGAASWWITRGRPPVEQVHRLRQKLHQVRMLQAANSRVNPRFLTGVAAGYDSTMVMWDEENEKLVFLRDYRKVRDRAALAEAAVDEAIRESLMQQQQMKESVNTRIVGLKQQVMNFEEDFGHFPYIKPDRDRLAAVRLSLSEGAMLYDKEAYMEASVIIGQLESEMAILQEKYERIQEAYYAGIPLWDSWAGEALLDSRRHGTVVVIIEKMTRRCLVYRNGALIHSFGVELGPNWMGPKRWEGDRATPEGNYTIAQMKSGTATRYHKALLIDYPNQEDKKRFRGDLEKGNIPGGRERMGHSIEIHGMGGKGSDWTDGCIALANQDMDLLYSLCEKGTRVTILGALGPAAGYSAYSDMVTE